MSNKEKKDPLPRIKNNLKIICEEIKNLTDLEFKSLVETGIFNELLLSIHNPSNSKQYKNLQERLLKNKNRLSFLAFLRFAIGENYSFKGNVEGKSVYLSPFHYQWLDNGVIFTQGTDKWKGLIGFYDKEGDLYYAKSKRNLEQGEKIDLRKDLFFDFFYQKIENIKEMDSKYKEKIIKDVKEIEADKTPQKKIARFLKWLDEKSDRVWYQTVKAFFDSIFSS
jgi:hypothetical protein